MEQLYQVWKIDLTVYPYEEEPYTGPLSLADATEIAEDENEYSHVQYLSNETDRIVYDFVVRAVHPEERF